MSEHAEMSGDEREPQSSGSGGNGVGSESYLDSVAELKGHESPIRAIGFVGIFLVAALAIGGGYWWWVQGTNKITALVKEARELQKSDDFVALNKARAKFDEAIAVRADPRATAGLAYVYTSLWGLYGVQDMKANAEKYVKLASDANVPNGDRFSSAAYLKIWNGQPEEARVQLLKVLDSGAQQDPKMLHAIGLSLVLQGKTREGREVLQKSIDLSAGGSRPSVAMAETFLRDGNYPQAWNFYGRALASNSEHITARIGRLLAQAKQGGKYDEMQKEIDAIMALPADKLAPSEKSFAEYTAAEIALARGDRAKATQLTDAAIGRDAKDARTHFLRGNIHYLDSKLDDALREWNEARKLDPFAAIYYFEVAEALREAGRALDAVQLIREYGDKNYKSDKYKTQLGIALADKGDFAEAEQIFKQMIEDNEYDADALFGIGYTYELQKKWDDARTNYGTADQVRRGWADPWYRMGYMTMESEKDYPTAREYFEKALEKYIRANAPKRKLAKCYLGIAKAYELEKKPKDAQKARETADELLK